MTTKFDLDDDSLVVIIGSGAGGGTLANELAQKGIKSVVLEAGPRFGQEDIVNDEWTMFNKISWLDKRISAGEWHGKRNHPTLPAWIVKGYGGSTIHWAGVSLRFQEHEFRMRALNGDIPGASVADWPLTLAELTPYYEAAERKMGVTGKTTGMPHLPWHNSFRVLAEGARRMGYRDIVSGPMAINSVENDGRPACQQYGFCMSGCMVGAKWSTMITELPRAEATGNCEIRCDAMALKIEHDATGKVTAVLYADGAGTIQRQKARLVCVAGNAIESPRLLLNSASSMFPDGLANSSGQVGRNYMTHNSAGVFAEMPEKVHMNRGTTVAGVISDEARNDPSRGFYAGYRLEILALGLPFLSIFLNPSASGWGREHAQALEKYAYMSGPAPGSAARTCRRRATASPCTRARPTSTACRCRSSPRPRISTRSTWRHMPMSRPARCIAPWGRRRCGTCPPTRQATTWAPTGWRRRPRRGWSMAGAGRMTCATSSSRTAAPSRARARRTRR